MHLPLATCRSIRPKLDSVCFENYELCPSLHSISAFSVSLNKYLYLSKPSTLKEGKKGKSLWFLVSHFLLLDFFFFFFLVGFLEKILYFGGEVNGGGGGFAGPVTV